VSLKQSRGSQLSDYLSRKGVVLADFCTTGSLPCEAQKQVVNLLSGQYGEKVTFETVDVDEYRHLAKSHRITSIPTLIFFNDGQEIKRFVGLQKVELLSDAIENVLAINI
jgi:thioredoxin